MLLYSSDAPAGWNALPIDVKGKFYNIAAKGDWTPQEAYDHLVPDTLKDNPDEVLAWMDGGEFTQEVWVHDQGVANGHYEQVTYEVPDRDVSRITSGENGGEYSVDNTIMEDMSINRARGAENMTDAEYATTVEVNEVDESVIDSVFETVSESSSTIAELNVFDILFDSLLPILASVKAGTYVASKCDTTEQKLGWGSLAAGLGAVIMASPAGPIIAVGYTGYKVTELGCRIYDKHTAAQ